VCYLRVPGDLTLPYRFPVEIEAGSLAQRPTTLRDLHDDERAKQHQLDRTS
jgi:hypothetical protein